jgi:type III pantothenate kinase
LFDWLTAQRVDRKKLLMAADLPLVVELAHPDRVGMDRLVDAVSVNRVRMPGHAAVIVDLGTAITVDLVSAKGVFMGGSILPGIGMSARALHQFTDLLPLLTMSELAEPPQPLGISTSTAMQSGLYWGAIGAIRELTARLTAGLDQVQVFLTGGAAPTVAHLLTDQRTGAAVYQPHLALAGIALAAASNHA